MKHFFLAVCLLLGAGAASVLRSYIQRLPDAAFPSATVNGFWGTLLAAQAGETGNNQRVAQFRATVYLTAQGIFPPGTATP